MPTWVLIIWVLHHQLALPGYTTEAACTKAAAQTKERVGQNVVTVYCIAGPDTFR